MPLTFTPISGDALSFTVDFDRFDCEDFFRGTGRWQYTCTIEADGQTIDAGFVRSGTTTQDNPEGLGTMLASFLSFLSAFAEAGEDSENADLFSPQVKRFADLLDGGQIALWADEIRRTV